MADEKKIAAEELTDEQANGVSGGFIVTRNSMTKKCATPNCKGTVLVGSGVIFCDECLREKNGS